MRLRFVAIGIVVCLGLLFISPLFGQGDVKSQLSSIEKDLWTAWKNADPGPFEQYCSDDMVGVGVEGIHAGKQQAIEAITNQPCQVRSFSLSDFQVHEVSDDTVLLTYKANQDATCGGMKVPADVAASSLYVKKGGKWLAFFHQESPLMQGAGM